MIVSTTLTGSNADIIGDALASIAPQVDRCIVIDTGARDDTLEVARRVAGDKLFVREFPWRNDFAAARNFALQAATQLGARWAVTVDTDERMHFADGVSLKQELLKCKAKVVLITAADGSYAKERIFRLPTRLAWKGPTHEAVDGKREGEDATLAGIHFSELAKEPAALKAKFERDVAILRAHRRAPEGRPLALLPRQLARRPRASRRGGRRVPAMRGAQGLGRGRRVGVLSRGLVPLPAPALDGRDRSVRPRPRHPPRHRRARLAGGTVGTAGTPLPRRDRVGEHGRGERAVRGRRCELPAHRLPVSRGAVRGPVRGAAVRVRSTR